MKSHSYLRWIPILILSLISINNISAKSSKPNILVILMDDLGYADVGFMPGAASDIYTPNIDKLAQMGTVFTSAYVSHPFCGPSRTSIMTGRMPHTIGAQFNLAAFSDKGITTSESFISNLLKDAGYYTGIIGKWHLGEESQFHPNNRGFDYFYGFLGGGHEYFSNTWLNAATYNPSKYKTGNYAGDYNRPMMENGKFVSTPADSYCTDELTNAGEKFIDLAKQENKPFFLIMSYNAPHTPIQAMPKDIAALKSTLGAKAATDGSERLTYTAMMYNADYNIKRLVEKLKTTGNFNNTLIVFLSDNGGKTEKGANNSPLKGKKGDAYEGGFRVPMFFCWPQGGVPQGYTNPYNFSSLDFYPTFAYLAGVHIPSDKKFDGINVWENVINKSDPRPESNIFVMRHQSPFNYTGVVKNNYKLYTSGNGKWYLYDLKTDIGENTDISASHPDLVKEMKKAVYEWSWTHIQPEFFDAPRFGFEEEWIKNNMPNFGKTFGNIYNANDYK